MLDIVLCLASSAPKLFWGSFDENKGEAHQPRWDKLQIFVDVLRLLRFDEDQNGLKDIRCGLGHYDGFQGKRKTIINWKPKKGEQMLDISKF